MSNKLRDAYNEIVEKQELSKLYVCAAIPPRILADGNIILNNILKYIENNDYEGIEILGFGYLAGDKENKEPYWLFAPSGYDK